MLYRKGFTLNEAWEAPGLKKPDGTSGNSPLTENDRYVMKDQLKSH